MDSTVEFTYIGVGTDYNVSLDLLTAESDQIVPQFVKKEILKGRSVRIIHFDPLLTKERLQHYFDTKGMNMVYCGCIDDFHEWRGDLECSAVFDNFSHSRHFDWLTQMCKEVCNHGNKLVFQEFTGHEMYTLCRSVYDAIDTKERFRQCILFDVSYGEQPGCFTDMSKYAPICDEQGFLNFTLMANDEIKGYIGYSNEADRLIQNFFLKQYKNDLNEIHVDYRRRLRGEEAFERNEAPDEIMRILQNRLCSYLDILRIYGLVNDEEKLAHLLNYYIEYDVYKWFDGMIKMVRKAPEPSVS